MPATVTDDGLGIVCVFSDGTRTTIRLDDVPAPDLAADLLAGLAELVHPHGSVDSASTVKQYVFGLRRMCLFFADRGFVGGVSALGRGGLAEYRMGLAYRQDTVVRALLRGFDAAAGQLDPGVRAMASGRPFTAHPRSTPLAPYSETEWARLTEVCQTIVSDAYAAHRAALAQAAAGRDPRTGGWNPANLAWLLARMGPCSIPDVAARAGVWAKRVQGSGGFRQASTALFPQLDVTVAYLLLFGVHSGVVPDGIADLGVGDVEWAGDATILLSYVKGRTGPEATTLPRKAVRLLEQWLAHSALLRGFASAKPRGRLWLGVPGVGRPTVVSTPLRPLLIQKWVGRHQLAGDDGRPLSIQRHRIRTTHQALRDKRAWTGSGRGLIDPNHSPAVEGDHYLTAATPTQQRAVDSIIEEGQQDMLRRAHPPVGVTGEQAAALAGDYPQAVSRLGLTDQVIGELVGGERDVFTAACADPTAGLHGPKGTPCPARPWVCLLCPLAVFTPRHAANLLRLKAFFARQWAAMPAAGFMAVFGPYASRIDEVLARYAPTVLAEAARHVGDHDSELPLRPEERTP
ncbi:hypothetical protein E0F15_20410 [Frankia sp. B2]|uniref:hypothetical protein n=1 Tax=unclassified Frankia TaxID=2632575 RepID=UPI0006C9EB2B|nr:MULTISPECIES: hypothetical protein [unclassified Frankia]KPM56914.1 hypothetical protein ACG83_03530 [Frankia sp. R43]TFE25089.1 hypothetical protein E0F15_20410 [Frankia sp. B2]